MRFLRKPCFAAALALALGGAQAAGTLNVAISLDPGSWDPIDTFLTAWGSVGGNLYDGLTMRGADLTLQPGLATSWEFLDDNQRLRFKLRTGVKFHNGEPFDAEAVKFSFERLLGAEGLKGPQKSNYDSIGEVRVVDKHTVDFVLKRPDPILLTKLAGYGAMIVPPRYIKEKGEAHFNANPVGTGPFKFAGYRPKVSITLARNDDYWGGKPRLDQVIYRFIGEPGTQVAELQAGRIDIATLIPLGLIDTVKGSSKADVISTPGPVVHALRFNTRNGITRDRDVRRALTMAVDRDAIVKLLLLGQARTIASFQGPLSFGHNPEQKPLPFDPEGARKLLAAAGVKPGAAVRIDVRGNTSNFREVAQAVAGYLQAVGVRATIKPHEASALLNDIIPNGKAGEMWQSQWGGWTYDYDNTAYLMYHSGQKWNPFDDDPKLNAMLEAQRTVYDRKRREAMLQEIAGYVADQALDLPLYSLNTIVGVNKRVRNLELPGDIRFRFLETAVD